MCDTIFSLSSFFLHFVLNTCQIYWTLIFHYNLMKYEEFIKILKDLGDYIQKFKNMNIIASKPQQLVAQTPHKVIVSNSGLCSHDWTGEKFKSYIQRTSKNYIP